MYLQDGTRDHFMRWLGREHPDLVDGYASLYARKYPPQTYRDELKKVVAAAKARHGVA
jgi:hypothetical protein